jgi:hypothetical protein
MCWPAPRFGEPCGLLLDGRWYPSGLRKPYKALASPHVWSLTILPNCRGQAFIHVHSSAMPGQICPISSQGVSLWGQMAIPAPMPHLSLQVEVTTRSCVSLILTLLIDLPSVCSWNPLPLHATAGDFSQLPGQNRCPRRPRKCLVIHPVASHHPHLLGSLPSPHSI